MINAYIDTEEKIIYRHRRENHMEVCEIDTIIS